MTREVSRGGDARTGQWKGVVRQSGPVRRVRGEPRHAQAVLSDLKDQCSPNYHVVSEVTRADLVHEEWGVVSHWLMQEWPGRLIRVVETYANASQALRVACISRNSTPVWLDSAGRVLLHETDERLSAWASRIARQAVGTTQGWTAINDAFELGTEMEAEAIAVLAILVDATVDDVATLCEVERDFVLNLVWGDL